MNDEERIAYLAGEPGGETGPDERAELDDLRALHRPTPRCGPSRAQFSRTVWSPRSRRPLEVPLPPPEAASRSGQAGAAPQAVTSGLVAAAAIIIVLVLLVGGGGKPPLHFRAALAGTALSPGARGEATLTKTTAGWRVSLHATGLHGSRTGASTRRGSRTLRASSSQIGTFNHPSNITLWAGVPPTSFPTLTVARANLPTGTPLLQVSESWWVWRRPSANFPAPGRKSVSSRVLGHLSLLFIEDRAVFGDIFETSTTARLGACAAFGRFREDHFALV